MMSSTISRDGSVMPPEKGTTLLVAHVWRARKSSRVGPSTSDSLKARNRASSAGLPCGPPSPAASNATSETVPMP